MTFRGVIDNKCVSFKEFTFPTLLLYEDGCQWFLYVIKTYLFHIYIFVYLVHAFIILN